MPDIAQLELQVLGLNESSESNLKRVEDALDKLSAKTELGIKIGIANKEGKFIGDLGSLLGDLTSAAKKPVTLIDNTELQNSATTLAQIKNDLSSIKIGVDTSALEGAGLESLKTKLKDACKELQQDLKVTFGVSINNRALSTFTSNVNKLITASKTKKKAYTIPFSIDFKGTEGLIQNKIDELANPIKKITIPKAELDTTAFEESLTKLAEPFDKLAKDVESRYVSLGKTVKALLVKFGANYKSDISLFTTEELNDKLGKDLILDQTTISNVKQTFASLKEALDFGTDKNGNTFASQFHDLANNIYQGVNDLKGSLNSFKKVVEKINGAAFKVDATKVKAFQSLATSLDTIAQKVAAMSADSENITAVTNALVSLADVGDRLNNLADIGIPTISIKQGDIPLKALERLDLLNDKLNTFQGHLFGTFKTETTEETDGIIQHVQTLNTELDALVDKFFTLRAGTSSQFKIKSGKTGRENKLPELDTKEITNKTKEVFTKMRGAIDEGIKAAFEGFGVVADYITLKPSATSITSFVNETNAMIEDYFKKNPNAGIEIPIIFTTNAQKNKKKEDGIPDTFQQALRDALGSKNKTLPIKLELTYSSDQIIGILGKVRDTIKKNKDFNDSYPIKIFLTSAGSDVNFEQVSTLADSLSRLPNEKNINITFSSNIGQIYDDIQRKWSAMFGANNEMAAPKNSELSKIEQDIAAKQTDYDALKGRADIYQKWLKNNMLINENQKAIQESSYNTKWVDWVADALKKETQEYKDDGKKIKVSSTAQKLTDLAMDYLKFSNGLKGEQFDDEGGAFAEKMAQAISKAQRDKITWPKQLKKYIEIFEDELRQREESGVGFNAKLIQDAFAENKQYAEEIKQLGGLTKEQLDLVNEYKALYAKRGEILQKDANAKQKKSVGLRIPAKVNIDTDVEITEITSQLETIRRAIGDFNIPIGFLLDNAKITSDIEAIRKSIVDFNVPVDFSLGQNAETFLFAKLSPIKRKLETWGKLNLSFNLPKTYGEQLGKVFKELDEYVHNNPLFVTICYSGMHPGKSLSQELQEEANYVKSELEKRTKVKISFTVLRKSIIDAKRQVASAMQEIQKTATVNEPPALPSVKFSLPSEEELSKYVDDIANLFKTARAQVAEKLVIPAPTLSQPTSASMKGYFAELNKMLHGGWIDTYQNASSKTPNAIIEEFHKFSEVLKLPEPNFSFSDAFAKRYFAELKRALGGQYENFVLSLPNLPPQEKIDEMAKSLLTKLSRAIKTSDVKLSIPLEEPTPDMIKAYYGRLGKMLNGGWTETKLLTPGGSVYEEIKHKFSDELVLPEPQFTFSDAFAKRFYRELMKALKKQAEKFTLPMPHFPEEDMMERWAKKYLSMFRKSLKKVAFDQGVALQAATSIREQQKLIGNLALGSKSLNEQAKDAEDEENPGNQPILDAIREQAERLSRDPKLTAKMANEFTNALGQFLEMGLIDESVIASARNIIFEGIQDKNPMTGMRKIDPTVAATRTISHSGKDREWFDSLGKDAANAIESDVQSKIEKIFNSPDDWKTLRGRGLYSARDEALTNIWKVFGSELTSIREMLRNSTITERENALPQNIIEALELSTSAKAAPDAQASVADIQRQIRKLTGGELAKILTAFRKRQLGMIFSELDKRRASWSPMSAQYPGMSTDDIRNHFVQGAMESYRANLAQMNAGVNVFDKLNEKSNIFVRQLDKMPVDRVRQLKAEVGNTSNAFTEMARSVGFYFTARTVVGFFQRAIQTANAFGLELRKIQSLATNFSFGTLYKELNNIDARFGRLQENAKALYWAYSSGVRGSERELAQFTETMSKTAIAIGSSVMPTMDVATTIMNAYGLSTKNATEVSDMLFTIVKDGKANAGELTASLGNVVQTASALGMSLDELGAAAATLTKTMRTNKALTFLNNILSKMIAPTDKLKESMEKMGIDMSITSIQAKGFTQVMREIHDATRGDASKIAELFPDVRGQRAALALLTTNYEDFMRELDVFRNKGGNMQEALGIITETPEATYAALKNTISMITMEAGRATQSFITLGGSIDKLLSYANSMGEFGKSVSGIVTAFAGFAIGGAMFKKAFAAFELSQLNSRQQSNLNRLEPAKMELESVLATNRQAKLAKQQEVAREEQEYTAKLTENSSLKELQTRDDLNKEALKQNQLAREYLKTQQNILKTEDAQRAFALTEQISTAEERLRDTEYALGNVRNSPEVREQLMEYYRSKYTDAEVRLDSAAISQQIALGNAVANQTFKKGLNDVSIWSKQADDIAKQLVSKIQSIGQGQATEQDFLDIQGMQERLEEYRGYVKNTMAEINTMVKEKRLDEKDEQLALKVQDSYMKSLKAREQRSGTEAQLSTEAAAQVNLRNEMAYYRAQVNMLKAQRENVMGAVGDTTETEVLRRAIELAQEQLKIKQEILENDKTRKKILQDLNADETKANIERKKAELQALDVRTKALEQQADIVKKNADILARTGAGSKGASDFYTMMGIYDLERFAKNARIHKDPFAEMSQSAAGWLQSKGVMDPTETQKYLAESLWANRNRRHELVSRLAEVNAARNGAVPGSEEEQKLVEEADSLEKEIRALRLQIRSDKNRERRIMEEFDATQRYNGAYSGVGEAFAVGRMSQNIVSQNMWMRYLPGANIAARSIGTLTTGAVALAKRLSTSAKLWGTGEAAVKALNTTAGKLTATMLQATLLRSAQNDKLSQDTGLNVDKLKWTVLGGGLVTIAAAAAAAGFAAAYSENGGPLRGIADRMTNNKGKEAQDAAFAELYRIGVNRINQSRQLRKDVNQMVEDFRIMNYSLAETASMAQDMGYHASAVELAINSYNSGLERYLDALKIQHRLEELRNGILRDGAAQAAGRAVSDAKALYEQYKDMDQSGFLGKLLHPFQALFEYGYAKALRRNVLSANDALTEIEKRNDIAAAEETAQKERLRLQGRIDEMEMDAFQGQMTTYKKIEVTRKKIRMAQNAIRVSLEGEKSGEERILKLSRRLESARAERTAANTRLQRFLAETSESSRSKDDIAIREKAVKDAEERVNEAEKRFNQFNDGFIANTKSTLDNTAALKQLTKQLADEATRLSTTTAQWLGLYPGGDTAGWNLARIQRQIAESQYTSKMQKAFDKELKRRQNEYSAAWIAMQGKEGDELKNARKMYEIASESLQKLLDGSDNGVYRQGEQLELLQQLVSATQHQSQLFSRFINDLENILNQSQQTVESIVSERYKRLIFENAGRGMTERNYRDLRQATTMRSYAFGQMLANERGAKLNSLVGENENATEELNALNAELARAEEDAISASKRATLADVEATQLKEAENDAVNKRNKLESQVAKIDSERRKMEFAYNFEVLNFEKFMKANYPQLMQFKTQKTPGTLGTPGSEQTFMDYEATRARLVQEYNYLEAQKPMAQIKEANDAIAKYHQQYEAAQKKQIELQNANIKAAAERNNAEKRIAEVTEKQSAIQEAIAKLEGEDFNAMKAQIMSRAGGNWRRFNQMYANARGEANQLRAMDAANKKKSYADIVIEKNNALDEAANALREFQSSVNSDEYKKALGTARGRVGAHKEMVKEYEGMLEQAQNAYNEALSKVVSKRQLDVNDEDWGGMAKEIERLRQNVESRKKMVMRGQAKLRVAQKILRETVAAGATSPAEERVAQANKELTKAQNDEKQYNDLNRRRKEITEREKAFNELRLEMMSPKERLEAARKEAQSYAQVDKLRKQNYNPQEQLNNYMDAVHLAQAGYDAQKEEAETVKKRVETNKWYVKNYQELLQHGVKARDEYDKYVDSVTQLSRENAKSAGMPTVEQAQETLDILLQERKRAVRAQRNRALESWMGTWHDPGAPFEFDESKAQVPKQLRMDILSAQFSLLFAQFKRDDALKTAGITPEKSEKLDKDIAFASGAVKEFTKLLKVNNKDLAKADDALNEAGENLKQMQKEEAMARKNLALVNQYGGADFEARRDAAYKKYREEQRAYNEDRIMKYGTMRQKAQLYTNNLIRQSNAAQTEAMTYLAKLKLDESLQGLGKNERIATLQSRSAQIANQQRLYGNNPTLDAMANATRDMLAGQNFETLSLEQRKELLKKAQTAQEKVLKLDKERIQVMTQVAEHEKKVADEAYQMAMQMNKFSTTAQQAINANTAEATSLRFRSFERPLGIGPGPNRSAMIETLTQNAENRQLEFARLIQPLTENLKNTAASMTGMDKVTTEMQNAVDNFGKKVDSLNTSLRLEVVNIEL